MSELRGLCTDCNLPNHEGRTCRENWDHLAANPPKHKRVDHRSDRLTRAQEEALFGSDDLSVEQNQEYRRLTQ